MEEFHGQSLNGILQFPKSVEQQRTNLLKKYDEKFLTERLLLRRPLRTQQQIKCHFGLLISTVIAKANDEGIDTSAFLKMLVQDDLPTGIGLTADFLHELFYLVCPIFDKEGHRTTLSKMDVEQASQWFDQCRNLLASRGIYVPDPNPNWRKNVGAGANDSSSQKGLK